MKINLKPQKLKILILAMGAVGFLLRVLLYTTGIDEKGLLLTNHWSAIAQWILTAAAAAALILLTRSIQGSQRYADAYPVSNPGGFGCFAAGAAFLISSIGSISECFTNLDTAVMVLGFVSAAAMVAVGLCRLLGAKPFFLFHGVVCLYLALRMVGQYRHWSSDPELLDYCFYMGANVALMLSSYQLAAFDSGLGNHRKLWLSGLCAVYLCCLALIGGREPLFTALCGGWIFTNLTNLTVRPRRRRPAMVLDDAAPEQKE